MKRRHDSLHLNWVRSFPCLVCPEETTVEAAHVRYIDRRSGKRQVGIGEKPDDIWAVPLCGKHHRDQHKVGERKWWALHGVDPVKAAMMLVVHRINGDREAAERAIRAHHE